MHGHSLMPESEFPVHPVRELTDGEAPGGGHAWVLAGAVSVPRADFWDFRDEFPDAGNSWADVSSKDRPHHQQTPLRNQGCSCFIAIPPRTNPPPCGNGVENPFLKMGGIHGRRRDCCRFREAWRRHFERHPFVGQCHGNLHRMPQDRSSGLPHPNPRSWNCASPFHHNRLVILDHFTDGFEAVHAIGQHRGRPG